MSLNSSKKSSHTLKKPKMALSMRKCSPSSTNLAVQKTSKIQWSIKK